MPIYEYHCSQCNKDFELLVRSSTKIECPDCGSSRLTRKLSSFAVTSAARSQPTEMCGTCGLTPGSCGFEA